MPSLFDSETDVPEERKVLKRTLSAQKITFILTALCAVIYLLQNVGFEEPIMDLFHYPAYSWEDQEVWRYFTHAIVHLSVPHILFNLSWFWLFGGASLIAATSSGGVFSRMDLTPSKTFITCASTYLADH